MQLNKAAACILLSALAATFTPPAQSAQAVRFLSGWSLLKEGEAEGTVEVNASNASTPNANGQLFKIAVARTADLGKGRVGASQSATIEVKKDKWYDIKFSALTQTGTVGLVFSLETADGKVLARTTLPELGRGRAGRGGTRGAPPVVTNTAPAPTNSAAWPEYLVSLHAREADAKAHLVITPIEPTTIWLNSLTLTERE